MTQKWRCDSCDKILDENVMTKICDPERRRWFRCKNCVKKWGIEPRSPGYYTQLIFSAVMGMENPKKRVTYGPRKKC